MSICLCRGRLSNAEFEACLQSTEEPHKDAHELLGSHNCIDERVRIDWRRLHNLSKVRLAHCNLAALPAGLHFLRALQVLDLSYNRLESVKGLELNSNLVKLYLQANRLEALPQEMSQLVKLEVLVLGDDLNGNRLEDVPKSMLIRMTRLRVLSLARNRLYQFPWADLRLPALEELDLEANQLAECPAKIVHFPRLRSLNLSKNQIEHLPRDLEMAPCTSLDLSHNLIGVLPAELAYEPISLALNPCFFTEQREISIIKSLPAPSLRATALLTAARFPQAMQLEDLPPTIRGIKCGGVCARCPFRFEQGFAEVLTPGVVNGHYNVPMLSTVCSFKCMGKPLVECTPEGIIRLDSAALTGTD